MEEFIQNRLVDKSPFYQPIKQIKLKTFASVGVVKKVTSTHTKVLQIKAERNIFGQLVLPSVKHNIRLAGHSFLSAWSYSILSCNS